MSHIDSYPILAATGAAFAGWEVVVEGVALITFPFFARDDICLSDALVRVSVQPKPVKAEFAFVAGRGTNLAIGHFALDARSVVARLAPPGIL